MNKRHSDKTASRILAAYCCYIVKTPKWNPIVNPEKKNLKHLESEQNYLDFAICREMLPCHSRALIAFAPGINPRPGVSTFRRGWIHPNLRNARVFWSHRSDALYQGTTSVVPLKVNKDMGFKPLRFFLCQVGLSVLL